MLDYFALGLLIFVGLVMFYGIIVLHDIPYEIAVHRNHPHQDAIHATGWVSLFTLHALWPFLWIWAMLYREDRGWGIGAGSAQPSAADLQREVEALQQRVSQLEAAQARARDANVESGGGI
ncbi:DUF3302 domain-containing protein [Pseudomonas sp. GD03860]|uniref:DUF3302 domain-containing protein n=1 Tax=Pseudomonas TaxID=286 RepID=UPI0023631B34|nr:MULTISPECIES: DUF3302 domain-containing protein [Pseudomonas]MDD2058148.1 DUF3302 domain-containing protein [Pseudomonas putida]MDH0636081.1 DUF3302 domain-containing protein [Pseudomonas sp. GD03860]